MTTAKQHGKFAANRGVPRNKRPLQNIAYKFTDAPSGGYHMRWAYERQLNKYGVWNFHGAVTVDEIKAILSVNQWSKFRQGVRQFTVQRRVDGRNIPKPGFT